MEQEIPSVVKELYSQWVPEPNPKFWPEYLQDDPIKGHGLYSFYQGLRLGIEIADACLEKV